MLSGGPLFVTGGAGFIGNRVVRFLLEKNYKVRCLVRSTTNTRRLDGLEYEKCTGDITDKQCLVNGMRDCAGVVHLAGLSNWRDIHSPKLPAVVIEGSKNVMEAARINGNIKTVYVSSSTAINGTNDPIVLNEESAFTLPDRKHFAYAHAKNKVERYCRECSAKGQPVTIVNPSEVYGPFDYDKITAGNLVDFVKTPTIRIPKGGTSIVHVDDVAKGIIAAFEKGRSGERYILGSDNLEIDLLARLTLELLGMDKRIKFLNRGLIRSLAWISRTFGIDMGFEPAVIPYAVRYWFMDNSKAKSELGINFRPGHEILKPTLEWLVSENIIESV